MSRNIGMMALGAVIVIAVIVFLLWSRTRQGLPASEAGIPGRVDVIDELLRKARARDIEILTSTLSRVEVAFASIEKEQGELDPEVEAKIDALWLPGSPIKTVEFYDLIAQRARDLMRQGIAQGWGSLKPADAIHLATAQQLGVEEFHTYDGDLLKWDGSAGFPITEPQTPQGLLPITAATGG